MFSKTALITGSSRGIGLAVAAAFGRLEYNIILNCRRDTDKMDEAVRQLQQNNPYIMGIQADISDYSQADRLFTEIKTIFGSVDVLVNNAGIAHVGLFQDMHPEEWERLTQINLHSVFNCCHLALPDMLHKQKGVILNISSVWGESGASCEAVYSASKGGINAFSKALGKELGPSGIRVNAIACGVINTEMNDFLDPHEKNALREEIPVMRFGTPEDVAGLAVFLASDQASYITAQVITLDGGWL